MKYLIFGYLPLIAIGINATANDAASCGQDGISRLEFLSNEQTRAFNASLQLGPPKPIEAMSLCDPSKVALPMTSAIAETFFTHIADDNSKVSQTFGVPVSKLLPAGVNITIAEDDIFFGNHPGYVQTTGNSIPNSFGFGFPREDAETVYIPSHALATHFPDMIYVHELGHVMIFLPEPPFGQFVKDYAGISQSFNEGFAEWISQLVYPSGSVHFGDAIGSPTYKAMAQLFDNRQTLTFLRPNSEFAPAGIAAETIGFCDQFHEPEGVDAPAEALCTNARKAANQGKALSSSSWLASQFSPETIKLTGNYANPYDPHYTGAPVFSFLMNLERETTDFVAVRDSIAAFKSAGQMDPTTGNRLAYRKLRVQDESGNWIEKEVPSLRSFFASLRQKLSPASQIVFDRLWTSFGMDKGLVLYEYDERYSAIFQGH